MMEEGIGHAALRITDETAPLPHPASSGFQQQLAYVQCSSFNHESRHEEIMNLRRNAILALIAGVLGFGATNAQPELDTVKAKVRVLQHDSTTLFLLGTIHGAHARNPYYTWPHLERIVRLISPDLLLVEIRPEHFKAEEFFSDGPIEMPFLVDLTNREGIACRPIDWWLDGWLADMSKADWNARDDRMSELLLISLRETKARKPLVTVGAGHIDPFINRLKKQGWVEVSPPRLNLEIQDYPDIPASTLSLWEHGEKYLSTLQNASTERGKQKIDTWKSIISGRGYLFTRSKR